jgi:glyoxylase-like metal-dependent hydrolase (beta-lactamase superfamily II)
VARGAKVVLLPLSGGWLDAPRAAIFADAAPDERIALPVGCWLVVHPRGRLVFDTGLDRAAAADPVGALGARRADVFRVASAPGDDVVGALAARGLEPDDVTHVVNSHLHFDHCGCNRCFPNARTIVQRLELEAAQAALEAGSDDPGTWNDPVRPPEAVDGEHDVFGDARVVAFPTPGHTRGHQSLRVTTGSGRIVVLLGDAIYTERHADEDSLPAAGAVWDAPTMRDTMARLRRMRAEGATLVYGHDDAQWRALSAQDGGID